MFKDLSLTCRECGSTFTWTQGEQEFYAQKGLLHKPTRCTACRSVAKKSRSSNSKFQRQSFPIVCHQCGKDSTVPFEPHKDQRVVCKECFRSEQPRY